MNASGALALRHRQGVERFRHLERHALWLKPKALEGKVKLAKIKDEISPSDLRTKVSSRTCVMRVGPRRSTVGEDQDRDRRS